MDNPFETIGHAFAAGLEKLHKRADGVEANIEKVKGEVEGFAEKIAADAESIFDIKDRLAKIEAMFSSDAVSAITDKVSGAGGSTASAPVSPTPPISAVDPSTAVAAVVQATEAPVDHVEPAVQAHVEATAAGSPIEVAEAAAANAAIGAGAAPSTAQTIAAAVTDAVGGLDPNKADGAIAG